MASIQILSGCREGQVLELLPKRQILGNSEKADVPVGDPWISRQHASIYEKDDRFWIEDLNSRNGTYVNCIRISKQVLSDEDLIFLGKTNLVFRVKNDAGVKFQSHSATRRSIPKFATDTSPLKSVQIPSIGDSRNDKPQPSRRRRKTTRTFKIEFPAESLRWKQQQADADDVQTELNAPQLTPRRTPQPREQTEALPAVQDSSKRAATGRMRPVTDEDLGFSPCAESKGTGLFQALTSRTRAIARDAGAVDDSLDGIFESSDEIDLEMSHDEDIIDDSQEVDSWESPTLELDVVALSQAEAAEVLDNLEIEVPGRPEERGQPVLDVNQRLAQLEARLRDSREENQRLRRVLEEARKTDRAVPRDAATVLERLASLEALMASRERDLDVLTEKFIEKEDEVDRLNTALEEAEAQISALTAQRGMP